MLLYSAILASAFASSSASSQSQARKLLSSPARRTGSSGIASDTSSLSVTYLATGQQAQYSHSDALFGIPAYGGGVRARVYYPTDKTGCAVISDPLVPLGSVVVLDRGGGAGCSFTTKVYNAQRAGAIGAIIVDSLGVCFVTPDCPKGSDRCRGCPLYQTNSSCQCSLPMMADDGLGLSIQIPSFLVGRDDGGVIKSFADGSGQGQLPKAIASLKWDIPSADGHAVMTMWQDSNDIIAFQFRQAFKPYIPYIDGVVDFTPHFYAIDGRAEGCATKFDCGSQCINGGFYCSSDPDGDMNVGISGADIVIENLRQLCVWQVRMNFSDFEAKRPVAHLADLGAVRAALTLT